HVFVFQAEDGIRDGHVTGVQTCALPIFGILRNLERALADGLDPRQGALKVAKYTDELGGGVRGLRIGVVKEGFGHPSSEADVDRSEERRVGNERCCRVGAEASRETRSAA